MDIHFSRHARQRIKLYEISRDDVLEILSNDGAETQPLNQRRELISDTFVAKYGWPIFLVYVREQQGIEVITIFPYDREIHYEDIVR